MCHPAENLAFESVIDPFELYPEPQMPPPTYPPDVDVALDSVDDHWWVIRGWLFSLDAVAQSHRPDHVMYGPFPSLKAMDEFMADKGYGILAETYIGRYIILN